MGVLQKLMGLLLLAAGVANAEQATVFWYSEQETGVEPSRLRYVVTKAFLRSDDGDPANGFVLLDRAKKTIYNVVPSSKTILVIDGAAGIGERPATLNIEERWNDHPDAPAIGGKAVREVQVFVDDRFCYGAVVVPGLDDAAAGALREFAHVLAARQLGTLDNTPEEYRDGCYLARYVYAPALHLARGLPVEEWDSYGRRRSLLGAGETIDVDAGLFELPVGYRRY